MVNGLVITALGNDKPGIVKKLSKTILELGGNITESHMMVLGGEFAMMLLITGEDAILNIIKTELYSLADTLGLTLVAKETQSKPNLQQRLPYQISVVSMDHPGIVHDISDFLSSRDINIEEIETTTYPAAHTGTPMFSLDMTISIPANNSIHALRNEFITFCDDLNLDATIESKR